MYVWMNAVNIEQKWVKPPKYISMSQLFDPQISLYVSETTVNIKEIRFHIHRKPCLLENHSKYRAFSKTTVNIERMHGWMDGWRDLENLKTKPSQNLRQNVLLETVWERFLLFRVGGYTEMPDHHKN